MRQLLCRDMGNECNEVIVGNDDDEVLEKTAQHLSDRHPEEEFGQTARKEVMWLIQDA